MVTIVLCYSLSAHHYLESIQYNTSVSGDLKISLSNSSLVTGIVFDGPHTLERFCIHYETNGKLFEYKDNVLSSGSTVSMVYGYSA